VSPRRAGGGSVVGERQAGTGGRRARPHTASARPSASHTRPTTLVAYHAVHPSDRRRSTGLGLARGRISHLLIDLRRRPYNTLAIVLVGRVVSELVDGVCNIGRQPWAMCGDVTSTGYFVVTDLVIENDRLFDVGLPHLPPLPFPIHCYCLAH